MTVTSSLCFEESAGTHLVRLRWFLIRAQADAFAGHGAPLLEPRHERRAFI